MERHAEPQSLLSLLRDTSRIFIEAIHDEELQVLKAQAKTSQSLSEILILMRKILQHAWMRKSSDTQELLLVLAVASREQRLRPLFGGCFDQKADPEKSILAYVLESIIRDHTGADDANALENALKLVSNCVADTNCNRKLALQKKAIEDLLRLGQERRAVDFIITALYNLCVEYDDPGGTIEAAASPIARANAAQIELAHSDAENGIVRDLFDMANGISPESNQRKPLLAGLLEMVSLTAPEDLLCIGILPGMDSQVRRRSIHRTLLTFLSTRSACLTSHDGETAVSVCNALLNVLAAPEVKQVLVSERQLQSLANFYHIVSTHKEALLDADGEDETLANLQYCEKALLQEFYVLSGLPEFSAAYTVEPRDSTHPDFSKQCSFIQICIERPRNPQLWTYDPNPATPSVAIAYTVLTNITDSEETAVKLVHKYWVHEPLQAVIRDLDDADTIYPALGLLSRLALPSSNKQEIVNCGMLDTIRRFLKSPSRHHSIDWKPVIRIEALTTLRRLISAQVKILSFLYEHPDLAGLTKDILELFVGCRDSSTKIEIGRLCVEHFRTISSAQDQINPGSKLFDQMMNQNNFAIPIAFLACEGPSPGAKAEGWFGLGLMTFWLKTRTQVLEVMNTPRMVEEVDNVADAVAISDRASVDNLKLVLSRVDLNQGSTTRDVFASAKQKLGL